MYLMLRKKWVLYQYKDQKGKLYSYYFQFFVFEKRLIFFFSIWVSRELLQKITEFDLSDKSMPAYTTSLFSIKSGTGLY